MSLGSKAIATGIAALSVSGVTIKDITAIPQQVQARDCPIMFPHPQSWLQGGNGGGQAEGPETFGTPTTRYWEFSRTYQYVFLQATVGSERGIYVHYSNASANIDAIQTAILALNLSNVDVMNVNCSSFGVIEDPVAGKFYGCFIDIKLRERVNQ